MRKLFAIPWFRDLLFWTVKAIIIAIIFYMVCPKYEFQGGLKWNKITGESRKVNMGDIR